MIIRNIFGNEYSGTIGKSLTVCTRYGKQYIRKWTKPRDPKTPWQLEQREKLAAVSHAWRLLTFEDQQRYRELAKGLGMTGQNLFVREMMGKRS